MPWRQMQFATQTAKDKTPTVHAEELVNLYVDRAPEGAKSPLVLRSTPGLKLWTTAGSGPCRGMRRMGSLLYVVSGEELYTVDWQGTATLVGTVTGAGPVRMTDNGTHVAIATRDILYAADRDGVYGLSQRGMNGATYQDGYGLFTKRGTLQYFWTSLDNMLTIDPLDFASKEGSPDPVTGCLSDHRELWLFGERTIEIHHNTGASARPFSRSGSGFVERGAPAGGSIAKYDNSVLFLGDDRRVYITPGYQPQRISTPQIEEEIESSSDHTATEAHVHVHNGHAFYVLALPDKTLVYDFAMRVWHTRRGYGIDRWRGLHHAEFVDRQIIGDHLTGALYELSDTTYDDNGDHLQRIAVAPAVYAGGQRMFFDELYLDIAPGVGLDGSVQGSDPEIMLDWSDDGGHTWSNEVVRKIGKIGERTHRVTWNRLGSSRGRNFRFTVSDPVPVTILDAWVRIEAEQ